MKVSHTPTAAHVRVALALVACGVASTVAVANSLYQMVR